MTTTERHRRVLRPVRRRHQRRPVPDVRAPPRRGAGLPQRAATTSGRCPGTPTSRRRSSNWETFSSTRSDILELIKSDLDMPPGVMIFEDPPLHTMHRGLMSRVFTPRRMAALEDQIRDLLRQLPRPARRVATGSTSSPSSASMMPMRVIGMLLGIPESDQIAVRDKHRRQPAHRSRQADGGANADDDRRRPDVRRLHRVAGEEPVRRPHDRAAQRRVRGRARRAPARCTRKEVLTYTAGARRRGQRDHRAGSSAGWPRCSPSTPTSGARSSRTARCSAASIDETLRFEPTGPHVARYVRARRRVSTARRSPPAARCCCSFGVGQPRRAPLRPTRRVRHPPRRHPAPHVRLRACTTASAPTSPGWRAGSRSTSCSTASPSGTSTTTP